ncbi:MAG: hypothetical protein CVV03_05245 [Firmicutes bacterium HGW-Firmicutes-8]|nr:MAG: hypothetical protein CVV03_05245 [Firmicutes bacterium HGW-Firmicutes-8]
MAHNENKRNAVANSHPLDPNLFANKPAESRPTVIFIFFSRLRQKRYPLSLLAHEGLVGSVGRNQQLGGVGYFIRISLALTSLAILLPPAGRKARGPSMFEDGEGRR